MRRHLLHDIQLALLFIAILATNKLVEKNKAIRLAKARRMIEELERPHPVKPTTKGPYNSD
jgi:hypothetical protein